MTSAANYKPSICSPSLVCSGGAQRRPEVEPADQRALKGPKQSRSDSIEPSRGAQKSLLNCQPTTSFVVRSARARVTQRSLGCTLLSAMQRLRLRAPSAAVARRSLNCRPPVGDSARLVGAKWTLLGAPALRLAEPLLGLQLERARLRGFKGAELVLGGPRHRRNIITLIDCSGAGVHARSPGRASIKPEVGRRPDKLGGKFMQEINHAPEVALHFSGTPMARAAALEGARWSPGSESIGVPD